MSPARTPDPRGKPRKEPPFEFVLDRLAAAEPRVKAFFGGWGVYVGERIVLILFEKPGHEDSGVWLATVRAHHESLAKALPSMRSIAMFCRGGPSGWQCLPATADGFERDALRACEMILRGDERIGTVPGPRKRRIRSR